MKENVLDPVVVDGAEGYFGRAIVRALLERGAAVRALVLPGASSGRPSRGGGGRVPAGAEVIEAPLGDADALTKAALGARAAVAARKLLEERRKDGLTFQAVHADRTRALLRAAGEAGSERFVHIGLAGADGASRGPLAEAERMAEAHLIASRVPTLCLRPSLVVGPGDGHVSRLARKARRPWPVIVFVGQGWARSAPLTIADLAECVCGALFKESFPAGELDVGGPERLTVMDIQDRLLAHFGRRKLKLHVIESVALATARILELVFDRPPISRARLEWLLSDLTPEESAARALLGRSPERFENAFAAGPRAATGVEPES